MERAKKRRPRTLEERLCRKVDDALESIAMAPWEVRRAFGPDVTMQWARVWDQIGRLRSGLGCRESREQVRQVLEAARRPATGAP